MEPWMNWENNRHIKSPDDKAWHMDHIKPKSSFKYKSIYDEEFKQCWALANLKPIEAKMNLVKSNFNDINSKFRDLYIRFVINNKEDKNNVWEKYFLFTIEEAREHIFKLFKPDMTFNNHGSVWHLDHIIPLSALPFDTLEDENFKKAWQYTNLQPLYIKDNLMKHNKYDDVKHYTKQIL
jgi:5-methylcytosine-specific restriction endonuclease McrA